MIQEETVRLLRLISEIHINIKNRLSTSSLLKEPIQVNTYSVVERLQFRLEMCCLSIKYHRVLLSAILSHRLEIKASILDVRVPTLPLLVILMTA
jgi:hypothetical protein